MFGCAELQPTVVLVVALLLTAGSTDAFAREFCAADTRNETLEQTSAGAIDLNRTNVALIGNIPPSMNVVAAPFPSGSIERVQKALDEPVVDQTYPQGGVKRLWH